MKRLVITGSSGYLGQTFVAHLRRHCNIEILGIDIEPPGTSAALLDRFVPMDILSSKLSDLLDEVRPDTIVHAAFVLAPLRDQQKMRRIDVDGCRNLLAASATCGVERLMIVSSATAYGAWRDNPVPMDESQPLRMSAFQYASDKVEMEGLADEYADQHPNVAVSRVRPAIIGGAAMDNYLYRFIFNQAPIILLDGFDTPVQFVHEDDVAAAMLAILAADSHGPFNVGPPDWCLVSEIAAETQRRTVRRPFHLMRFVHWLAWATRRPGLEVPAEFLDFARYPWVVAPRRLEQELGFKFRHSSRETLLEIIRSRRPVK